MSLIIFLVVYWSGDVAKPRLLQDRSSGSDSTTENRVRQRVGPWGWDRDVLGCQQVDVTLIQSDPSLAGRGRAGVELDISAAAELLEWTALDGLKMGPGPMGIFSCKNTLKSKKLKFIYWFVFNRSFLCCFGVLVWGVVSQPSHLLCNWYWSHHWASPWTFNSPFYIF